jgi:hypothetical protein
MSEKEISFCVIGSGASGLPSIKSTVANFSPEYSGTEKDQRGYPLCFKSEIFIFIMKSFNT